MNEAYFIKINHGDKIKRIKVKPKELSNHFSESDIMRFWLFDKHVKRVKNFSKPLRARQMRAKIALGAGAVTVSQNIPTELRLSALLNEIRPFMLNEDPIYFESICNLTSKNLKGNREIVDRMREYKNMWKMYDISHGTKCTKAKAMMGEYIINGVRIHTYPELLNIFIYGKYIHNEDKLQNAIIDRVESAEYYKFIKIELGACIVGICDILNEFDRQFLRPILKYYGGSIKDISYKAFAELIEHKSS